MKRRMIPGGAFVLMIALASCTQSTAPSLDNPNGAFRGSLTLYDSTAGRPRQGTLYLSRGDSTDIVGTWSLGTDKRGRLVGRIVDSTVTLNLNPEWMDANTILMGTFDGTTIKGQWYFSGVMGPVYGGEFVAARN